MNKLLIWLLAMLPFSVGVYAQTEVQRPTSVDAMATSSPRLQEEKYYLETHNLQYYALPTVQLSVLETRNLGAIATREINLPSQFEPIIKLGMDRKKALAYVMIPHFIKQPDGAIVELVRYQTTLQETGIAQKQTGNRTYASHSVLRNGTFYKIAVGSGGICKVDYDFVVSKLGIDPASVNLANIRVYGNGGQMLPESNMLIPEDDLIENPIRVVDNGDGIFNTGDYFAFYAPGPHTLVKDSANKGFKHQVNIYSDRSFYFLNFDLGVGKRIVNSTFSGTPNANTTSFNEYLFHERDSVNFGRFGKEFWGDEMSNLPGRSLAKTLTFTIPNIDASSPAVVSLRSGSVTKTATSNLRVTANGVQLASIDYAPFGDNYYDPVIQVVENKLTITTPQTNTQIGFQFTPPTNDATAFIGHVGINARRNLVFNGYLNFADWLTTGPGKITSYSLTNVNASTEIWDVTDPLNPLRMPTNVSGTSLSFVQEAASLHRFVATDFSNTVSPINIEKVANQDLHNAKNIDYIIITPSAFRSEAERLALHHQSKRGFTSIIATPQEIYNEFSSGSQDIAALRNFIKMIYDKSDIDKLPNSVLLFGDASYDYKDRLKGNTNLVPTHETAQSNNKILGYCSDDFYGFLDDNENLNDYSGTVINTLDVGVGRFPVNTTTSAAQMVNKVMGYDSPASFGPWKNIVTFCADNGDAARHLDDGEIMYAILNDSLPAFNAQKIYVDGFQIQSTPAGPRAPDANKAVLANMFNGTFLMNYNGHGGPGGWCEERIFSFNDINNLKNLTKLPLFITATCDFAPFDNPAYTSAGETLVLKPDGGAIALMTTTQLVFADQNQIMNANYMKRGFSKKPDTKFPTLGESYRLSKNLRYNTYVSEETAANFRKFALLGDPALPLAIPKHKVFTDSINGVSVTAQYDTLKALGKYTIAGHVTDENGIPLTNFNGVVYPTIFDKPKKLTTLQSMGDPKREYFVQNNAVYKGKASVRNGKFSFTFVMPKDINYEVAKGKISYYVNSELEDGSGFDKNVFIGGNSGSAVSDNVGPVIKAYMNDEKFVDGGITPSESKLLLKLFDDNGINYSGNSIGHDITAVLDNNPQNSYVLNSFFEADLDDYRSGVVRFPLNYLTEGEHVITIKAWDVLNNSSEKSLRFVVVSTEEGKIAHVLNYPNPFSTQTQFMFEHNMPGQNLNVRVQVLSLSGKVVKQLRGQFNTDGTRICALDWDGKDEYGDMLGNGVYLYKLHVKSDTGLNVTKLEKLIILR
jgi:hypothetical protein